MSAAASVEKVEMDVGPLFCKRCLGGTFRQAV